jgi:hypothetical protein
MPSLGSYDELRQQVASVEDINAARDSAEKLVKTSRGILQFDAQSEQRMRLVLASLNGPGERVLWKMADNTTVELSETTMSALIEEATANMGARIQSVFARASLLKTKKNLGQVVTLRDISTEQW